MPSMRRAKEMICVENWKPETEYKHQISCEEGKIYWIKVDPSQDQYFWARADETEQFGWVPRRCLKGNKKYANEDGEIEIVEAYNKYDEDEDYPNLANNENWLAKRLTNEIYQKLRDLSTINGYTLDMAIQTGVDNPQPAFIGCSAGDEETYAVFSELFEKIITGYHNEYPSDYKHPTCMDHTQFEREAFDEKYVVASTIISNRNIRGFCMPPYSSRAERRKVEEIMKGVMSKLGETPEFTGKFESLVDMAEERKDELVGKKLIFDKPADPCLVSAGIARDWPDARGCYVSDSEKLAVWVNEEDHCRMLSTQNDGNMGEVLKRFCVAWNSVEAELKNLEKEFMHNEHLGYLVSSPAKLGTALRATIQMKIPLISSHDKFEEIIKNLRLQKSVVNAEEATFDISNIDCLGFSEVQIVTSLCDAVNIIIGLEKALEAEEDITEKMPEPIQFQW